MARSPERRSLGVVDTVGIQRQFDEAFAELKRSNFSVALDELTMIARTCRPGVFYELSYWTGLCQYNLRRFLEAEQSFADTLKQVSDLGDRGSLRTDVGCSVAQLMSDINEMVTHGDRTYGGTSSGRSGVTPEMLLGEVDSIIDEFHSPKQKLSAPKGIPNSRSSDASRVLLRESVTERNALPGYNFRADEISMFETQRLLVACQRALAHRRRKMTSACASQQQQPVGSSPRRITPEVSPLRPFQSSPQRTASEQRPSSPPKPRALSVGRSAFHTHVPAPIVEVLQRSFTVPGWVIACAALLICVVLLLTAVMVNSAWSDAQQLRNELHELQTQVNSRLRAREVSRPPCGVSDQRQDYLSYSGNPIVLLWNQWIAGVPYW